MYLKQSYAQLLGKNQRLVVGPYIAQWRHYWNEKLPSHTKRILLVGRQSKLLDSNKSLGLIHVQNGQACFFFFFFFFWQTPGCSDHAQRRIARARYSFAKTKNISMHKFYAKDPITSEFNLPLSPEAFNQLLNSVQSTLHQLRLIDQSDVWNELQLGTNKHSQPQRAYTLLMHAWDTCKFRKDAFGIGDAYVNPNTRFTSGSSSKDRLLSTRNLLTINKIQLESYNCVLNLSV